MRKILIIEDEPDILDFLGFSLEREGFEIFVASDGESGLAIAYAQIPDIVLCDIMMSGLTGYEVGAHLSRNPATAGVPIIFVSALSKPTDVRKGMALADDYITKPFDIQTLLAAIESRLRKSDQIKSQIDNLIKEKDKEIRQRYLRQLDDAQGVPITSIIGIFQLLLDDLYPGKSIEDLKDQARGGIITERERYILDGLTACGQLYSSLWAFRRAAR